MRTRLILILTLANLFLCSGAEQRKSKPVKLEITAFQATRTGTTLTFDGKVRNVGDEPARGVKLVFTLLNAKKSGISTRRGPIDDDPLEAGDEAAFVFESAGNEDAIEVRIEATAADGRAAQITNGGPFRIE